MTINTKQSFQRLKETVDGYLSDVERFNMEQLTRKPSEEQWSLGQMFLHLISSALHTHLPCIEHCREQAVNNKITTGKKTEAGEELFKEGGYAPVQIKVPASDEYTPKQPESKEQIVEGFEQVLQRMSEVEATLDDIPPESTYLHHRLGSMNAKEWFAFIEMHYRHHLRQKARLEIFLKESGQ